MILLTSYCLLSFLIVRSQSLPTEPTPTNDQKSIPNYASHLSRLLATSLLKDNMEIDSNNVYSPLGVATTLAILAEGSSGDTYNEFNIALGFPKIKDDIRQSYKRILQNFQSPITETTQHPSFKTWLYIYRNYTAFNEFKDVLTDSYFVEVKDINRSVYNWDEPNTSLDVTVETSSKSNSKDVIGFETLKKLDVEDPQLDEDLSKIERTKEASKFDKFIDDKQYVEVPLIREEISREKQQESEVNKAEEPLTIAKDNDMINDMLEVDKLVANGKPATGKQDDEINVQDNETVQDDEKIDAIRKNYGSGIDDNQLPVPTSNEPQKVTIPLEKLEQAGSEIMQALESHFTSRRFNGARSIFQKDDITSALSANSITGREAGSHTKMLLFNGLYYRSNWAYPFQELRSGPSEEFHLTDEQSINIPMMHTRGTFRVADLDALNARSVSFPYENQRYSLLVIVPNNIEGLHKILDGLTPDIFSLIRNQSIDREIYVSLPKFQIEETSRSESMLKSLGLRKLFTRDQSDLSKLSSDSDLHVDEIVQFVSVRVDEGATSETALSASNIVGARTLDDDPEEKIEINRPFLYFVLDNDEDLVIVSGKILVPDFKVDVDVDLEAEYAQP